MFIGKSIINIFQAVLMTIIFVSYALRVIKIVDTLIFICEQYRKLDLVNLCRGTRVSGFY